MWASDQATERRSDEGTEKAMHAWSVRSPRRTPRALRSFRRKFLPIPTPHTPAPTPIRYKIDISVCVSSSTTEMNRAAPWY